MSEDSALIRSLRAAVSAAPADVPLRLHLAELLLAAGSANEAMTEAAVALQHEPANDQARALLVRAMDAPSPRSETTTRDSRATERPRAETLGRQAPPIFDWPQAERQVADIIAPRFVEPVPADAGGSNDGESDESGWGVERSEVTLADVGGLVEVKKRLEAAFLAPMRNPELRRMYGKSLRGGLLLYGPPGCGKTFIARAVAGELGARFLSVGLSDVLDMYIGQSERNLHAIFDTARRNAPCVLFLDEVDALGGKRSNLRHSAMRGTVNQLLAELDGAGVDNEGVFVLAATNHPWDVDSALRRPGRLDRTLLVLPPDEPAREAILRYHLRDRPIAGVDLGKLVKATDGWSGADLAHLCETAAETALLDSAASGQVRMIDTSDLTAALHQVRPSIAPWLAAARNVALFANEGGIYDDLLAYLKRAGKL